MIINHMNDLIGRTPLLRLHSLPVPEGVHVYAKLEMMNPGGSIKDRLGVKLIEDALVRGDVQPGGVVVEPTAGNTGIGLALACNVHGLRLICVTPEKFSLEKQRLMRLLGAEVMNTPTELGMSGAIERARLIARELGGYVPQQFENPSNPSAYTTTLARELLEDVPEIDVFVAGAGSGGTFTGVASVLKPNGTRTIIVEPEGSVLNGGPSGPHRTEGIGVEAWPPFLPRELVDDIQTICDEEAFYYVRHMALRENVLTGSSSGAAVAACVNVARQMETGTIVTVFPDGAERYLSQGIVEEAEHAYQNGINSRR